MMEAEKALTIFQRLKTTLEGVEVHGSENLSRLLGSLQYLDELMKQCREHTAPAAEEAKK